MTQEDKNVTTLTKEIDAFKSMHHELLKTHKGLFVAIHNGKIIDHDKERFTLVKRIPPLKRFAVSGPACVATITAVPSKPVSSARS